MSDIILPCAFFLDLCESVINAKGVLHAGMIAVIQA